MLFTLTSKIIKCMSKFECKPYCKKQWCEAVELGCPDCIKKVRVQLTSPIAKEIDIILKKYNLI